MDTHTRPHPHPHPHKDLSHCVRVRVRVSCECDWVIARVYNESESESGWVISVGAMFLH